MEKEHMETKSEDHPKKQKKQEEKSKVAKERKNDSVTCIPLVGLYNKDKTTITFTRIKFYA